MSGLDWQSIGIGLAAIMTGYFSAKSTRDAGKSRDKRDEFKMLFDQQGDQIKELQNQIKALNNRVDKLSSENDKFKDLNTKLQNTNHELMQTNNALKEQNSLLKNDLNDYKTTFGELKKGSKK